MKEISDRLFALQDKKYADFQAKLIPGIERDRVIGVRTPVLRALAKELVKEDAERSKAGESPLVNAFLAELPHAYFDEDQLHAFIISLEKDHEKCMEKVEAFLPYVNNWATCDQLSPKVFKKHKNELLPRIDKWMASGHTYKIRFAIGMLMEHFLDEDFDTAYPDRVAAVRSDEYYINMMIAWYFATALAKQYEAVLPYIEGKRLDRWTHNKAIQKAVESYRITPEQKEYLKSLRLKKS